MAAFVPPTTPEAPRPNSLFEKRWDMQTQAKLFDQRITDALSMQSIKPPSLQDMSGYEKAKVRHHPSVVENVIDMLSSGEAWEKDIMPRVGPALKDAAIAAATGVPGAPFDLAYLLMHTTDYMIDRYNGGTMEWLGDMPNFSELQGSSDWLADQIFDQDVDSLAYAFGGLLSPDASNIANIASLISKGDPATLKAMMVGAYAIPTRRAAARAAVGTGGKPDMDKTGVWLSPETMAREVPDLPEVGRRRINRYNAAIEMEQNGVEPSKILESTGWGRQSDGSWGFFIDSSQAKFNPKKVLNDLNARGPLQGREGITDVQVVSLGDVLEFPELFENYPELAQIPLHMYVETRKNANGRIVWDIPGLDSTAVKPGGSMRPGLSLGGGPSLLGSRLTLRSPFVGTVEPHEMGMYGEELLGNLQLDTLLHEVQHFIQKIEGWANGGLPQEVDFGRLEKHRINAMMVNLDQLSMGDGSTFEEVVNTLPDKTLKDLLQMSIKTPDVSADGFFDLLATRFGALKDPEKIKLMKQQIADKIKDYQKQGYNIKTARELGYQDTWLQLVLDRYRVVKEKNPGKELLDIANIRESHGIMEWIKDTLPHIAERNHKAARGKVRGDIPNFEAAFNSRLNADRLQWESYEMLAGEVGARQAGEFIHYANKWKFDYKKANPNATDEDIAKAWERDKFKVWEQTGNAVGSNDHAIVTAPWSNQPAPIPNIRAEYVGVGPQKLTPSQHNARINSSIGFHSLYDDTGMSGVEKAAGARRVTENVDDEGIVRESIFSTPQPASRYNPEIVHGNYVIPARRPERTASQIRNDDMSYFNKRRNFWRKELARRPDVEDPEFDGDIDELLDASEEEVRNHAIADVKRREANRESIGYKLPHGLNKVKLHSVMWGTPEQVDPITLDILKNPTEQEFKKWSRSNFRDFYKRSGVEEYDEPEVRVITDVEGNLYVWDADQALHTDVIQGLGVKYNGDDDWTDVDGIPIKDLFSTLEQDGIYTRVAKE